MSRGIYDKVNKVRIPIAGAQVPDVDETIIQDSSNPVAGGAVYDALQNIHIDVDSTLSNTSENPVQNKVIKSALDNKADSSNIPTKTSDLTNDSNFVQDANYTHISVDSAMSDSSTNTVQNKIIKQYVDALQTAITNGNIQLSIPVDPATTPTTEGAVWITTT